MAIGLGKFEKIHFTWMRSRDLLALSVVPQPLRYRGLNSLIKHHYTESYFQRLTLYMNRLEQYLYWFLIQ
jgi:hypothetical protein